MGIGMDRVDDDLRVDYVRERCEELCTTYQGVRIEAVILLEEGGLGVIVALREGLDLESANVRALVKELEKLPDVRGVYVQLAGENNAP
jgi:hypothetical protein